MVTGRSAGHGFQGDDPLDVTVLSLAGTSYYVSSFANTLADRTDVGAVRVLVPAYSPETATLDRERVEVIELDLEANLARSMLQAANPFFVRRLLDAIDDAAGDVLHIINEMRVPFYLPALANRSDQAVVLTVHEPDPYLPTRLRSAVLNPIQESNLRSLARFADRFVVHGEVLKGTLSRFAPAERIAVVPHGSFAPYFTRHRPAGSAATTGARNAGSATDVLFFGRIAPGKGVPSLVQAGRALGADLSDLRVTIAGSPSDEGLIVGLEPAIFDVRPRRVPEREAAGLFDRADVVAMPYTNASASGIISIAGGFETPVVASAVGAFPEVLADGETGLLVPPGDATALAGALRRLLTDRTERSRMGARLRREQERNASWDIVAEATLGVYRDARRSGSPSV